MERLHIRTSAELVEYALRSAIAFAKTPITPANVLSDGFSDAA
jgi:hypothetical protein